MRASPLFEERLVHLANNRRVAGRRADLRDARAHQPTTQYTDGLDLHLVLNG